MKIKIGTRGSKLAVRQAEIVCETLLKAEPALEWDIITISTKGDRNLEQSLNKIGGKGLFVKEIELALLQKEIDIAVHSMKDMPGELPEGLILGGVLPREDVRDALVTRECVPLSALPVGAKIGTGSLRRQQQLAILRPDLECISIRGNILTRLKKLEQELDGVILAAAGLKRLSLDQYISQYFSIEEMVPAACQGILAIEIRENDKQVKALLEKINDSNAYISAIAERAFLNEIGADCHAPVGVYSMAEDAVISLSGFYNGIAIHQQQYSSDKPEKAGEALAKQFKK